MPPGANRTAPTALVRGLPWEAGRKRDENGRSRGLPVLGAVAGRIFGKKIVNRLDVVHRRGFNLPLRDLGQRRKRHARTGGNTPLRDAFGAQICHHGIVEFGRGIHERRW